MTLPLEERHLLKRLEARSAEICEDEISNPLPAYPRGDRRCKPAAWIDRPTLQRWIKAGYVIRMADRIRVAKNLQTRLAANDGAAPNAKDKACQHQDIEEKEMFDPQGRLRPVRINGRVTAFGRLARSTDARGVPLLSKAQIEAGILFARDYAKAGMGQVSTQCFDAVLVDDQRRYDRYEAAMISRLDRQRRVQEAISCLGPGLDRALIQVCCEGQSVEQLERAEKWGRNAGLEILRLALSRLSVFYGTQPGQKAKPYV